MRETPNIQYIEDLAGASKIFKHQMISMIKKEFPIEQQEYIDNYKDGHYLKAAEIVNKLKHKIGMFGLDIGYNIAIAYEQGLLEKNTLLHDKFMLTLHTVESYLSTLTNINCLIIDEEPSCRFIIRQLCNQIEGVNVVEEYASYIQAAKVINKMEIDVIFIGINAHDSTNFDFMKALPTSPQIIVTTASKEIALEAKKYDHVVDYLIKPIALQKFVKVIQKSNNLLKQKNNGELLNKSINSITTKNIQEDNDKELYINIGRRLVKINISSINIIAANGDYITIKTEDKKYTVHSTMKKIEQKLPQDLFLKVHRSYIINIKKIIDIENNSLLIDRDVIPVSRSNRAELMKRLNLL